jgi:hypothetical protein
MFWEIIAVHFESNKKIYIVAKWVVSCRLSTHVVLLYLKGLTDQHAVIH